jgi:glycosyltransferase involved in cell wall biosynthesis
MKLAVITCGMLPIPAVQGGAVENMIDFYLEYNRNHNLHDITVYSPWDPKVRTHPALSSDVNHYHYIDVTSLRARIARKIYSYCHHDEYYNYFIEYYFEKVYQDLKKKDFDYIIIENGAGLTYKLSQRGHKNLILHLNNDLLNSNSRYHDTIFNSLSKILTCSNYIKERVSTIQPSNKIQTLYNAIDVNCFFPKETSIICREQMGFTDDDFVIAYSGRVNNEKGISELIDAMLLLKDSIKYKLMIIGGTFYGNAKNEDAFVKSLKEKAEIIKDRIVFTGFVPYNNMPDYLHLADIAVLPSMWDEPFGLTIVEALAAGLPLITTRSGGIPEICEGVATIVERKDIVNNLATAILDLYNDSEKRKKMATASIERAKLFDKEPYAERFFAALIQV